jgi:hypothetical protein
MAIVRVLVVIVGGEETVPASREVTGGYLEGAGE